MEAGAIPNHSGVQPVALSDRNRIPRWQCFDPSLVRRIDLKLADPTVKHVKKDLKWKSTSIVPFALYGNAAK